MTAGLSFCLTMFLSLIAGRKICAPPLHPPLNNNVMSSYYLHMYERLVVPQLLQVIDGVNVAFITFGNSYSGEARGLGMQIFLQGFRVLI